LLANFDAQELLKWGFTEEELNFHFDLYPEGEKDDEVPEVVEPFAKAGDIYQLGKHRVMCGDSTRHEDMDS
jgi:hypothetical protein